MLAKKDSSASEKMEKFNNFANNFSEEKKVETVIKLLFT